MPTPEQEAKGGEKKLRLAFPKKRPNKPSKECLRRDISTIKRTKVSAKPHTHPLRLLSPLERKRMLMRSMQKKNKMASKRLEQRKAVQQPPVTSSTTGRRKAHGGTRLSDEKKKQLKKTMSFIMNSIKQSRCKVESARTVQ